MQLRRLERFVLIVALAVGAALPLRILDGDAGRLLVTFLGLVSASILPTISLILGSMVAAGRSVRRVNQLEQELSLAMDALFVLFGLSAVTLALLVAMSLSLPPLPRPSFLLGLPFGAEVLEAIGPVLHRIAQGVLCGTATLVISRSSQIPGILRRSMAIRHEIAVDEARRKTLEAAPAFGAARAAFATHPNFGRTVAGGEAVETEPH